MAAIDGTSSSIGAAIYLSSDSLLEAFDLTDRASASAGDMPLNFDEFISRETETSPSNPDQIRPRSLMKYTRTSLDDKKRSLRTRRVLSCSCIAEPVLHCFGC